MGHAIVAGGARATSPSTAIMLGDIAEGSIVKLNENGSPAEFYVAKQNYESTLNGTGRTLLVRKDCYNERVWHTSKVNSYSGSDIDSWLTGTYKLVLDSSVQSALGTTKFYYTPGNGNTTVTTLLRSVFLLSATELGFSGTQFNEEGSALPISSVLQIAKMNGSTVNQWTRSPCTANNTSPMYSDYKGACAWDTDGSTDTGKCSRPCFTLPETTMFDGKTLELKEVA